MAISRALVALALSTACSRSNPAHEAIAPENLSAPTLRRLTLVEYRNAVVDLVGDVTIPADLEALDQQSGRFSSVRAGQATISEHGIEQFVDAALAIAQQAFADPARAAALVGSGDFARRFGRRAWRRPLTDEEAARFAGLGAEATVAAMLASPNFLFRAELGRADAHHAGVRRYDGYDMASRLSFLLWQTTPDDALLDAAAAGALDNAAGVRAAAARLVASPRARAALLRFFDEDLGLDAIDTLGPRGAAMRSELEQAIETMVFDEQADVRGLLDLHGASVEPQRVGLLGFAGILALGAHGSDSSPTLRGRFVRERLLGQIVAPPPPGADVSAASAFGGAHQTMRDRLAAHRADPACAGCHAQMDPLGLALEHFDGNGAWRDDDRGLPIDTRSDLDGIPFDGEAQLSALLHDDPRVPQFLVTQLARHALGRMDTPGDAAFIAELTRNFAASGYRFLPLVVELTASPHFRFAADGDLP